MGIEDKAEEELEQLEDKAARKKLSREEKEKMVRDEIEKARYYDSLGMI